MSGEPGGGGGPATTSFNNNVTTTTSPAPESAITTELLLAIIVPTALIVLFCAIGCLRYCRKGKDEQISHDEELVRRGREPADGIILSPNSKHYITRLGRVDSSSIMSQERAVNRRFLNDDDYYNEDEEEEEYSGTDSDNNNNNNNGSYRNDYVPSGLGAEYGLDGLDTQSPKRTKSSSPKNSKRNSNNGNNQNRPPPSSSAIQKPNGKNSTGKAPPGKWQGLKRFNPDSYADASDGNTSDLNSQSSLSRLPPAPGEAAILNPFGRANAHAIRNTTPTKRQLYDEKQKQQLQQQQQQPVIIVPGAVRVVSPSQQQQRNGSVPRIHNNNNPRSASADRGSRGLKGTSLSDLGITDL
jgi:hypothetical protein